MFDAEFIKQLEYLSLLSKRMFRGQLLAQRRTMQTGGGIEFADHREYMPGDDLRYVDWNVYARHGDLLLKRFQEEEDLHVYILVDSSVSMEQGGKEETSKFLLARQIAAALAYIALSDLDRVSVLSYDSGLRSVLPLARGKGQIISILDHLKSLQCGGDRTDLKQVVGEFVRRAPRSGLAIVISDLFDHDGFRDGIDRLRYARFEPHVVQIYTNQEADPKLLGDVELIDCESDSQKKVTITESKLRKYRQLFAKFLNDVETYCLTQGLSHIRTTTDVPFDAVLLKMMRSSGEGLMSFSSPDRIIWLLIAVPIVVFYILKPRLRRRKVSTLLFWDQIFEEKRQRTLWQNLRHWLSLFLQLVFVGLLVLALIDPVRNALRDQGQELVLIIDNSASMQAVDSQSNSTRLGQALQKADEFVVGLRPGDRCAILTSGNVMQVVSGMTEFIPTLRDAVERVSPTDGPSDIRNAIEAARRLAPDPDRRRIVVISDACDLKVLHPAAEDTTVSSDPEALEEQASARAAADPDDDLQKLLTADDILWVAVGSRARPPNAAITTFQARRSTVDPLGYCLLAEVTNASDESLKCRFRLELSEALVDVFPLNLEPNGRWRKTVNATSETGGLLVGTLEVDDALAVDNVARAVVPSRPRISVTLVKADQDDAYYLTSVLEAIPLLDLTVINKSDYAALSREGARDEQEEGVTADSETDCAAVRADEATVSSNLEAVSRRSALTVFSGVAPESLPEGALLVVGPPSDGPKIPETELPAWTLGPEIAAPLIAEQDPESPLLRHVRLQNVLLTGGRDIVVNEQWGSPTTLLRTAEDAAVLVSVERPEGRVVLLSADLDSSDLPLRIAFPVMMTNSVNWFLRQSSDIQPALVTGRAARIPWVRGSLQDDDSELSLIGPQRKLMSLQRELDRIIVGPQPLTGVYAVLRQPSVGVDDLSNDVDTDPVTAGDGIAELISGGETQQDSAGPVDLQSDRTGKLIALTDTYPQDSQLLTVNLCNRAESDLGSSELPDQSDRRIPASGLPGWLWLVMIASGFIVFEWALYHRRMIA